MSKPIHSLKDVAEDLDRMRADAVAEAHPMLALLLQLARDEAREELERQAPEAKARHLAPASNVIPFPPLRVRSRKSA